jgi:hypothetical protein
VADVFIGRDGAPDRAKVVAAAPDTADTSGPVPVRELARVVGTYYSPELDISYRLAAIDGRLTVQFGERAPIALHRAKNDEFFGMPMTLQLKFTRATNGMADGFLLSARRVQSIRFVRH